MSNTGDKSETENASAEGDEPTAKDELFEAIDHFKNAASLLFQKVADDKTVKNATAEAETAVRKISGAAEPLVQELTKEVGRLTKDIVSLVEARPKTGRPPSGDAEASSAKDEETRAEAKEEEKNEG